MPRLGPCASARSGKAGPRDTTRRWCGTWAWQWAPPWRTRIDGAFLLWVFIMPPILILGAAPTLVLYFQQRDLSSARPSSRCFRDLAQHPGQFRAFFEIAAAVKLDGNNRRIQLLPLNILAAISCTLDRARDLGPVLATTGSGDVNWSGTRRWSATGAAPPSASHPAPTSGMPDRPGTRAGLAVDRRLPEWRAHALSGLILLGLLGLALGL